MNSVLNFPATEFVLIDTRLLSTMNHDNYRTSMKTSLALSAAYSHTFNSRCLEREWDFAWISATSDLCSPYQGLVPTTNLPLWIGSITSLESIKEYARVEKENLQDKHAAEVASLKAKFWSGGAATSKRVRPTANMKLELESLMKRQKVEKDALREKFRELKANRKKQLKNVAKENGEILMIECLSSSNNDRGIRKYRRNIHRRYHNPRRGREG